VDIYYEIKSHSKFANLEGNNEALKTVKNGYYAGNGGND
jgi:hypothetical protein